MTFTAALGFDSKELAFTFRTAIGAALALWLAWALRLEHPQWAAMSVWAASQPLRGQLLEKSFFRLAGTLSGTLAGITLVLLGQLHPALLVGGLALWVAACTGIGNLQNGLVGYGTVLAGYTAAMVSLLDVAHPEAVLHVGLDRLATVLTGVSVATLTGLAFAKKPGTPELHRAVAVLVADVLNHLAAQTSDPAQAGELLGRIAAAEEALAPHAAGSLRSRKEIRAIRAVLISAIAVVLQRDVDPSLAAVSSDSLKEGADRLRTDDLVSAVSALTIVEQAMPDTEMAQALTGLRQALAAWRRDTGTPTERPAPLPLHRDWIGAREAALRAGIALLAVGALWQVTGWSSGNFMLLGLSVMISLFSTFENPVQFMRWVVLGQLCGVAGMLVCRWLVWPLVTNETGLILTMVPFILFGSLLGAHRHARLVSFDYNMVFLLLLRPHWPLTDSFPQSVALSIGVLMAPLLAWAMYLTFFPANLQRRIDTLVHMMHRDLAALARDPDAPAHRTTWRARLYHRTLRLIRMCERSFRARDEAITQGLEILRAGQTVQRLHRSLADPHLDAHDRRTVRDALEQARRMAVDPAGSLAALNAAARLLPRIY